MNAPRRRAEVRQRVAAYQLRDAREANEYLKKGVLPSLGTPEAEFQPLTMGSAILALVISLLMLASSWLVVNQLNLLLG